MAGDWIKMRMDLQTHPKVVRISSYLKADKLTTIGALHAVWCIFDTHSSDGVMDGYSPDALDSMIGLKGFCCAMMEVEWMDYDGQSLVLPNFSAHNGKSAKKRVADSERKREARMSAKCPQNVRDLSDNETDKSVTREEKRREEKKEQKIHGESGDSQPVKDVQQKKGSRLSSEWQIPDDWIAWATQQGIASQAARFEADKFRDFWIAKPGQGGVKSDWQATWRNWIRNVISRDPKIAQQQQQSKRPRAFGE